MQNLVGARARTIATRADRWQRLLATEAERGRTRLPTHPRPRPQRAYGEPSARPPSARPPNKAASPLCRPVRGQRRSPRPPCALLPPGGEGLGSSTTSPTRVRVRHEASVASSTSSSADGAAIPALRGDSHCGVVALARLRLAGLVDFPRPQPTTLHPAPPTKHRSPASAASPLWH